MLPARFLDRAEAPNGAQRGPEAANLPRRWHRARPGWGCAAEGGPPRASGPPGLVHAMTTKSAVVSTGIPPVKVASVTADPPPDPSAS